MENKVVESLKCFTESLLEGNKPFFPKLETEDLFNIYNYIWFFQYLLDYSKEENSVSNFNTAKFGFNDYLTDIIYKDTFSYNNFIKNHRATFEHLKQYGVAEGDEEDSHEFLYCCTTYAFDDKKNILKYTIWKRNKCLKKAIKVNGRTAFVPIEQIVFKDDPDLEKHANFCLVNNKNSQHRFKYVFKKISDGIYVESQSLEDGSYYALQGVADDQTRVYIYDLKNNCERQADSEIESLLKQLRNNLSAHNNIFEYEIKNLPSYLGYVVILKSFQLALILPREIMRTVLESIAILTPREVSNFSMLYYENNSSIATEENLEEYLKNCKLVNIVFKNPQEKTRIIELLNYHVFYRYSILKEEVKATTRFEDFIKKELAQYNSHAVSVKIENVTFIDEVKKFLTTKIECNKNQTLEDLGEAFSLVLRLYGNNIIDKNKVYGHQKDYIFRPLTSEVANALRQLCYLVPDGQAAKPIAIENLKILSGKNFMYKDYFVVTAILLLIYINLINNKLCDNINYDISLNQKQENDLLEQVKSKYDNIFHFSYFGKNMESPSQLRDFVKIFKAIRNSIAHNNFAINYAKSGKIKDSNLYFIDKYENMKVVCKVGNFLDFITSDMLTQYKAENIKFVAENFEDLKSKIVSYFQTLRE